MSIRKFFLRHIIILLSSLLFSTSCYRYSNDIQNFNLGWRFYKGDDTAAMKKVFDDSAWRVIDLPHDWSIEGPFSQEWASGTGYLPGGTGWYRKSFTVPSDKKKGKVFVYFDGIYNNSEVWINGNYLGKRPNGYISFQYDLTPYVFFGKENVIAVKADHSEFADSRWYTGSGIYRDVKLIYTPELHTKLWGVSYTTPEVSAQKANMVINVTVVNEMKSGSEADVHNYLLFSEDTVALSSSRIEIGGNEEKTVEQIIEIPNPKLWDVSDPNLYKLITIVESPGGTDKVVTDAGIRYFHFDPDKGFSLNGRSMKLKGVCLHHDAGALGSAVPEKVLERRLVTLKESGCNAIRTSHNPFSSEFLNLCDRIGFLVIDEAFDEWELPKNKWIKGWNQQPPGKDGYNKHFEEWAEKDLADFVLRDRNHPCVIMWSIGNEIDYPNDPYTHPVLNTEANRQTRARYDTNHPDASRLGEIAENLVSVVKSLDKTRPVTAGLASVLMSNETGFADALDVVGYNYQEFRYPGDHSKYPLRVIYGSENDMPLGYWKVVTDNDYVVGQFIWTGIDYLGEAGKYPDRHSIWGLMDLAGNIKPEYYFRQSLWSDKPVVFIGTTESKGKAKDVNSKTHNKIDPVWNYEEGQMINVDAYTNCDEVELLLNSKSLGSKKLSDFENNVISWEVPYSDGTLEAVARSGGKKLASYELITAGEPSALVAWSDSKSIIADRQDIAHIFINITDEKGRLVYNATNEVTCTIKGPARILGMEDSNPVNTEDYKDNTQHAWHGKLLLYVQSLDKPGKISLELSSPGLKETMVELDLK